VFAYRPGKDLRELKVDFGSVLVRLGAACSHGIEHHNAWNAGRNTLRVVVVTAGARAELVDQRRRNDDPVMNIEMILKVIVVGACFGKRETADALAFL
jgi:hypothetical protein